MIQLTPHMRILVAFEPLDFRNGIDGLARVCKEVLREDPFCGAVFVFRNRRGTAIKALVYDGQGFWLVQKRLSSGYFRWWPARSGQTQAATTAALTTRSLAMQTTPNEFLEFTRQELDEFIGRMVTRQARDADFDTTAIMAESYFYVMEQIRLQRVSLRRLRQMLFGARTEKTATVLGTATSAASSAPAESASSEPATPDPPSADTSSSAPPSGHGRHAADAYGGAERVTVPHPSLHAGDPCPECQRGTLYRTSRPKSRKSGCLGLRLTGRLIT
jgi:transposase